MVQEKLHVPGNASRTFESHEIAIRQHRGHVSFGWDTRDPYLRNLDYAAQTISFDEAYCTSRYTLDGSVTVQTLDYFVARVLPHLDHGCRVTEIGCGQGEFVERLRELGIAAHGYDPVLLRSTPYLIAEMWDSVTSPPADLIVMRCVLPHIEEPWKFLDSIAEAKGDVLVLVEFQRLEWTLENQVWSQFCHDHVNQFSFQDFETRYELIDGGEFAYGEWGWVLFSPKSRRTSVSYEFDKLRQLEGVLEARKNWLRNLREKNQVRVIWGGAAKGTVLADAMAQFDSGVAAAIDANPQKWGRYMEGSGVQIISPSDFIGKFSECEVLVANPNHYQLVSEFLSHTSATVCTVTGKTF